MPWLPDCPPDSATPWRIDCPPDPGTVEIAVLATGIAANVQAPAPALETAVAAKLQVAGVETAVVANAQDVQRELRPVSCPTNAETAIAASATRAYTAAQCHGDRCHPCWHMARHKMCKNGDACRFCHGPHSRQDVAHPGGKKRQRAAKRRAKIAQNLDAADNAHMGDVLV